MSVFRHLSYSLLVPAINRYVGNITSWWNAKVEETIYSCIRYNSGSLCKNQDGFWARKNHRDSASSWHFLLDSSFRDTAWHFPCSPLIRNHRWHLLYSHCCLMMSHSFTETSFCRNIPVFPSLFIFIFVFRDVDHADVYTTRHPGLIWALHFVIV